MKKITALSPFGGSTPKGNVCLNFTKIPEDSFLEYGRRFHDAAKLLTNSFKAKRGYSDAEACPIVFLYRHTLELYVKGVFQKDGRGIGRS